MNDMSSVIVPKSDQISADDLLAGPLTITITKMDVRPGTEQPVTVGFDGDGGRPYKPCKSMMRVMVNGWGADAGKYIGKSMTIYRDDKVKWGGMEVGGIRISHMEGLDRDMTMALTEKKGSKKLFTVRKLVKATSAPEAAPQPKKRTFDDWLADIETKLKAAQTQEQVDEVTGDKDVRKVAGAIHGANADRYNALVKVHLDRTAPAPSPAIGDDEVPF